MILLGDILFFHNGFFIKNNQSDLHDTNFLCVNFELKKLLPNKHIDPITQRWPNYLYIPRLFFLLKTHPPPKIYWQQEKGKFIFQRFRKKVLLVK